MAGNNIKWHIYHNHKRTSSKGFQSFIKICDHYHYYNRCCKTFGGFIRSLWTRLWNQIAHWMLQNRGWKDNKVRRPEYLLQDNVFYIWHGSCTNKISIWLYFLVKRYKQLMVPEWENWYSKGINILIQSQVISSKHIYIWPTLNKKNIFSNNNYKRKESMGLRMRVGIVTGAGRRRGNMKWCKWGTHMWNSKILL